MLRLIVNSGISIRNFMMKKAYVYIVRNILKKNPTLESCRRKFRKLKGNCNKGSNSLIPMSLQVGRNLNLKFHKYHLTPTDQPSKSSASTSTFITYSASKNICCHVLKVRRNAFVTVTTSLLST